LEETYLLPKFDLGRTQLWELRATKIAPKCWPRDCVESPSLCAMRPRSESIYQRSGSQAELKTWLGHFTHQL